MEGYIYSLSVELDVLTSEPPPKAEDFIEMEQNFPLGPTSNLTYSKVKNMSIEGFPAVRNFLTSEIRSGLRSRVGPQMQKSTQDKNGVVTKTEEETTVESV